MTINTTVEGSEATIAVEGWLDTQAAPEFLAQIDQLGEEITSLVIDFSNLDYIASPGLRAIVAAYKKMNGAIVIRGASKGIVSIFRKTGIDRKIRFE